MHRGSVQFNLSIAVLVFLLLLHCSDLSLYYDVFADTEALPHTLVVLGESG